MALKACITVIAVVYVVQVVRGAEKSLDSDSSGEDYELWTQGCPFLVAENRTGFGTTVSCQHNCNGAIEKVPEGEPCYTIGEDGLGRMKLNLPYNCSLGECSGGVCVPNGRSDVCFKRTWEENNKAMA
uniref:Evasin P467 n=1 Tax=Rhipicephalus pulchellus TaxID=72859 RepID=EV467_RHIPC|nr:RecName: Full=Evasin P467; Flags: Precursor [Rhipicephalus pulchellus]